MNWESIVESLGLFTIGSMSIAGIIIYFSKRIFENQISILTSEHQYRFSTLYTEKLSVFRETYKRLVKAEKSLEYLLRPAKFAGKKSKKEISNEAYNYMISLFDHYDENEIFFDNSSVKLIEQLREKFTEAWGAHWQADFMEEARGTQAWLETIENKTEIYKKVMENEIPSLKEMLKKDFQKRFRLIETIK